MGSLRFLVLFALLLSIFFAVSANTSNEATHAKDEVKPSEATDVIEPQKRGGCRYGCCNRSVFGRCKACCSRSQAVKADANSQPQATETEAEAKASSQPQVSEDEANEVVVEPQQAWGGGCRYGCCGGWMFGRCRYCCRNQAEANEVLEAVEPQQRGQGGGGGGGRCRYGCCGGWRYGRCNYCCSSSQAVKAEDVEANLVEPQQGSRGGGGGCRYGCCGGWRYGRCTYCCSRAQDKADVVEPQQRGGCWFGCCGSYMNGQCSACCLNKMDTEEEKKKEEAKP